MNLTEILDAMDDILDKSTHLPFSGGRTIVDANELHNLVAEIRLNLPADIRSAQKIVADRAEILSSAKAEAETIIKVAKERAKSLVEQEEIVKQAAQKANEIMSKANESARELKHATNEYVDNSLKETEQMLIKNIQAIKDSRAAIKKLRS